VPPHFENDNRLIDAVFLIGFGFLDVATFEKLDHPTRIEIHLKADASANLRQVFDRQPQTPRSGGTQLQPVRAFRKELLGQRIAEFGVVNPEIVHVDAHLRHTRRAARLKDEDRVVGVGLRHPAPHRTAPEPLILKEPEAL
jgi:hypothetical protein